MSHFGSKHVCLLVGRCYHMKISALKLGLASMVWILCNITIWLEARCHLYGHWCYASASVNQSIIRNDLDLTSISIVFIVYCDKQTINTIWYVCASDNHSIMWNDLDLTSFVCTAVCILEQLTSRQCQENLLLLLNFLKQKWHWATFI